MRSRAKLFAMNLSTQHENDKKNIDLQIDFLNDEISELQEQRYNQEKLLVKLSSENKILNTHFEVCKQKYKDARRRNEEMRVELKRITKSFDDSNKENSQYKSSIAELNTLNQEV